MPKLIYLANRMVEAETPYNRDFIEKLKQTIPKGQRYWDPKRKRWGFEAKWAAEVALMLQTHFGNHEVETESESAGLQREQEKIVQQTARAAIAKLKKANEDELPLT